MRNMLPRFLFLTLLLVAGAQYSFSQDDPNVDNTVGIAPLGPGGGGNTISVITTPDGYDNFDLGTTNAEPHMASNPLAPQWFFNAFNTNTTFHTENGTSWTSNNPAFPTAAGDPVAAYDSLGNLYYETMKSPITACWVVKSTNNGLTWGPAVTSVAGNDKNWMACDQTMGPYANSVYTTMTPGNFARSTDGGATFQTTASMSNTLPGMMVAVGPNVLNGNNISGGCVYVVRHTGTNAAGIYTFHVSTDGGATFTQQSTNQFSNLIGTEVGGRSTVQGMRCRPYPMIAADNSYGPYRGRFYLVYASNNPAGNGNKSDIFLRYSTDQGVTWSAPAVANDDVNSQNNFQFHPAIWCDKETGRLYIKFYDTRRVPTSDSMDVYATYTDDGGATFAPNQRLTNRTFRINFTGGAGPTYRGDYDAITSNRHASMSVWTDFRNSNYLGMTAYFPDFAMLASHGNLLLGPTDSSTVVVRVPSVKLYTNVARFSASVSPAAPFTFSFLGGRDSLVSYPDSVSLKIRADNVTPGNYTVTIAGQGPNGTPIHRRTIAVTVTAANAIAVSSPNGGETLSSGSSHAITWSRTGSVDSVRLEYSTDNGTSWNIISQGVPATPASYSWTVPNTPTTLGRVRASWTDSSGVNDISNAVFTIVLQQGWTTQTSGAATPLNSIKALSATAGWIGGNGARVLRTVNGGTTWTNTGASPITGDVYAVEAVDANTALVTTSPGATFIYRTTNAGASWTQVYTDASAGAFINAIKMFDANNGIAMGDPVGGKWVILRTADGGATWVRDTANAPLQVGTEAGSNNGLATFGSTHIWFPSNTTPSKIYMTPDGGTTWSSVNLPFSATFTAGIAFNSTLYGVVGANGGQAARTVDGGASWTSVTIPGTGAIYGVTGSGLDFFVSRGANVYRSTDRGVTWAISYTGAVGTLNHVNFATSGSTTRGWAVSATGGIASNYATVTGVGGEVGSPEVPQTMALLQNYPNPFNPTTTISYTLHSQATVQLKVFNMLGQEVATLVNDPQPGGSYSVNWDANNDSGVKASSGVYFYRLEATMADGKVINDMKKMVLLK